MNEILTIVDNVQAELVVKKSKFICNLIKVESKQEAEETIKNLKKKYHDARHNCIAYRVFENDKIIEKSSDDGEPSGTAGAPMLNILKKNNLCNILLVVTRYFGGILLGTGGLVRAYSDVSIYAIEKSEKITKAEGIQAIVKLEYNNLENFKNYCKRNNIFISKIEYSEIVICKIEFEILQKEKILNNYKTKEINLIDLQILGKKLVNKLK